MFNKIMVDKPEECPFRYSAPFYDSDTEYCTIQPDGDSGFGFKNETCNCTDERFIEGCPLLELSFLVEKINEQNKTISHSH